MNVKAAVGQWAFWCACHLVNPFNQSVNFTCSFANAMLLVIVFSKRYIIARVLIVNFCGGSKVR